MNTRGAVSVSLLNGSCVLYAGALHDYRGAPSRSQAKDLRALLPESRRRAYDVRPLVRGILDEDPGFQELQEKWASNVVIGLGRLAGATIGVVASNPFRKGGCLDSRSAEKAARFVRMCDAFAHSLAGDRRCAWLPSRGQGRVGRGRPPGSEAALRVRRSGGAVCHTGDTEVVWWCLLAMNSRSLGATAVFTWPDAGLRSWAPNPR
jgi:acetyl-CoA/propionyl-CoA carboxylase carboxyl transferase subunit